MGFFKILVGMVPSHPGEKLIYSVGCHRNIVVQFSILFTSNPDQAVAGTGGGRTDQHDQDGIISMEERMRSMMRADCARVVPDVPSPSKNRRERDHCTSACLREAGVAGYQGDSEEEKDVEIAITNAEFRAKQRLDATSGQGLLGDGVSELVLAESPDSEIDIEQLEDVSGYGRK